MTSGSRSIASSSIASSSSSSSSNRTKTPFPCNFPGKFPDDGLLVGSASITSSPNVTEPTNAVNQAIPTPSIYYDGRGEIHNISVNDKDRRLNILYTRKGVMRSGDLHPNVQCDFVFAGSVQVWTLEKDGSTKKTIYGPKQYIEIPPYVPHVFNFLEDTVIAEWWEGRDGTTSNFRAWFYKPYRCIVDESFTSSTRGIMKLFEEKNTNRIDSQDEKCSKSTGGMTWTLVVAVTGGIALSTLSFALGSRFGKGR
mmetsp:Transcript_3185/g.7311  ORF Transcript_3185/g.7311 Transcript_3185/m.7311 type:complete len:253 (-) Transcript_3185:1537-2295(-)